MFVHLVVMLLIAACVVPPRSQAAADSVVFGRDVRPILAKHCFKCHGPDPNTREAGLRLDQQEAAIADLGGYAAIVPGEPDQSEVIVRVTSDDRDLRMPPVESGPPLSETEIQVLRDWIEAGGRYETHWAFVPPTPPPIPDVDSPAWCRGAIDRFMPCARWRRLA